MKCVTRGLLTLLAVGGVFSSAQAAIIVNDNFEYASQAAFEAAWVPIGTTAPISAELSTEQFTSSSNSAKVPAQSGTTAADNGKYRNRLTFSETGILAVGDQLLWSFDFYDAQTGLTSTAGNPGRNFVNLQDTTAPSGTPQLISMGLNNNLLAPDQGGNFYMARLLGGASNGGTASAYFKLNDAGAPLRSTGWHNLKVVLSNDGGAGTDFQFYVDNILSETVSNVGTTLRSYDNIALGSGLTNGNNAAYFDNMYLEFIPAPVPEPTTAGILLIGGAALALRRRRGA